MNLTSKVDFVKANIDRVKGPGATKRFENAGPFVKRDYGEVPHYLERVKARVDAERDYLEMLRETQKPKPARIAMDDECRLELLEGLKSKYDQLSEEYQVGLTRTWRIWTIWTRSARSKERMISRNS